MFKLCTPTGKYIAGNGNQTSETNRLGITTDYLYNDVGEKIRESFDIYEFNYTDRTTKAA